MMSRENDVGRLGLMVSLVSSQVESVDDGLDEMKDHTHSTMSRWVAIAYLL